MISGAHVFSDTLIRDAIRKTPLRVLTDSASGDLAHLNNCDQGWASIVDDELSPLIEPLKPTPEPRRKKYPGRLPVRGAMRGCR